MIYIKPLFAALLLAFATSCEAEYTRLSRTVRGSTEETSRLLNPAGGKGGKSKKGYQFTNPKKGEEVCIKQTKFLIDGPSTAIPSANAPSLDAMLPAGVSFEDCNDLLSVLCRGKDSVFAQVSCLFPAPQKVVSDFTKDVTDFYKCLEGKGVINGPWFFHRDTPGSKFRFTTENDGGLNGSPGSVCSKITHDPIPDVLPAKAEIEFFSEEFFETKLSDFVSFSVDYKLVSQREATPVTKNSYFVNIYVRLEPSSPYFYDCNFGYYPDAIPPTDVPTDWKTFRFDLNTKINSGRDRNDEKPPISTDTDKNCKSYEGKTLQDFLKNHPSTVIGVGTGDPETINLVVGETGDTYKGLEVCWDNAQVTTKTKQFVYDFEPAA